ncbi:MAG: tRNA(Ile)-lysidine synthase [Pseudomonadota bacterium]|jgi:tRNA(Ile)-lysidine synthase
MFTHEKLRFLLEKYADSANFWLAYSGGLDSQVLLHALSQLLPLTRLRAIHINHRWHVDALKWAQLCQHSCDRLGIDCEVITVDARAKAGQSPEAYARRLRYKAIAERIPAGDYLLTAHHRDDQAETLLLQLLRGSGLRGLASMPFCQAFAEKAYLMRPLLKFSRAELYAYAKAQQLIWIEDSSNTDLRFNRNFIRHQALMLIQQRWPQANKTLARTAENISEAHGLLEEIAHDDWHRVQGPNFNTLIISALLDLSVARRRNVLRHWLSRLNFPIPSQKQLLQIEALLVSKVDASPQVNWAGVQLRRYRDSLYALNLEDEQVLPHSVVSWRLNQALLLPKLGLLTASKTLGQGLTCSLMEQRQVEVDFRHGGERFHSSDRSGSHPLKKLFQEWGVPPWQRNKIPLIFYRQELIAVAGYAVHADFAAKQHELGLVIKLVPTPLK